MFKKVPSDKISGTKNALTVLLLTLDSYMS